MTDEKKSISKERGRRVKEARKRKKLTQGQLAEAIICSRNNLAMIERGERGLTLENAEAIASVCGVLSDWLLLRVDYPTKEELYNHFSKQFSDEMAMWDMFVKRISRIAGYDFYREQSNDYEDIHTNFAYAFRDKDGIEYPFDWSDSIIPMLDTIEAHAVLELQRLVRKKQIEDFKRGVNNG